MYSMDAEPRHTAQTQKNTAVAVKAEGKSSHGGVFFFVFFSLFACFYFSCLNSFLPLSSSPPYSISSLSHYVSLAGLWQCEYPLQRVQPDWSASLWRPINSKQTEVSFLLHLSHITQTSHRSIRTVLDKSAAEGKLPCWAQWVLTDA